MDFYVMSTSKVELKVVRLQSQINIFDTALMFRKQSDTSSRRLTVMKIMMMGSLKKLMFLESDVTKCTAKGNVGIICMVDDHNYYLAKLITDIHGTGESGMDNNNHEMHVHQKVITCSYLQIMKI